MDAKEQSGVALSAYTGSQAAFFKIRIYQFEVYTFDRKRIPVGRIEEKAEGIRSLWEQIHHGKDGCL